MATKKEEVAVVAIEQVQSMKGQDYNIKMIDLAVKCGEAVLLIGETGTGKTSLVKDVARQHGKKWIRFNLTGETTVDEFVGKYIIFDGETVWQDGVLLQAIKSGHWLICDEINAALPEILFVLHSLLDDDRHVMVANHDGEVIHPHEDFRFFATMNPVDEYAGTKELNKAFKSRFGMILFVQTPDSAIEVEIVRERCGLKIDQARLLVTIGNAIRQLKKSQDVYLTVSTRDLIQWGNLSRHVPVAEAFAATVVNKSDSVEEREKILNMASRASKTIQAVQEIGNTELDPDWFDGEIRRIDLAKNKNMREQEQHFQSKLEEMRAIVEKEEREKLLRQLRNA